MSLKTSDQKRLVGTTEAKIAEEFIRLAQDRDIKLTCFLTGKLVEEEPTKSFKSFDNLEIGGHTYNAFKPEIFHRISKKLIGSYCGPKWYQKRDIRKTVEIIRKRMGIGISSWRNHAYFSDRNTLLLLQECGIKILSDGTSKGQVLPILDKSGVYTFPINILPDHEHLFHSDRTPETVKKWVKRYNWSDVFTEKSYSVNEWYEIVKEQIKEREQNGEISVAIIHPICLYLCDGNKTILKLLDFFKEFETIYLKESVNYIVKNK